MRSRSHGEGIFKQLNVMITKDNTISMIDLTPIPPDLKAGEDGN